MLNVGQELAMVPANNDTVHPRLHNIQERLRSGWWIETPVLGRDAYRSPSGAVRTVEFILCYADTRQVIAVPDGQAVREFLQHRGLSVVEL